MFSVKWTNNLISLSFFFLDQMEFLIEHTWDSNPVTHEPIRIGFSPGNGGLKMEASGPFFNDPAAPPGPPSQPFPGLWDYEGGQGLCIYKKVLCYMYIIS